MVQVLLYLKFLLGQVELPPKEQMLEEEDLDLRRRQQSNGITEQNFHYMETFDELWKYEKRVCELGRLERIPDSSKQIYNLLFKLKKKDPVNYKQEVFEILPNGEISHKKGKHQRS